MKGHSLPGINQKMDKSSLSDGRAKSSAFQKDSGAEKPGAPAIWPFKKKIKGTNTELVKVKNKQTQRGKKISTTPEWKKKVSRVFNKTTKKISDKIKEPGKSKNIPGFN